MAEGSERAGESRAAGQRTAPELVQSIAADSATLVRKEVELARQEIEEGVTAKLKAAGAFVAAGGLVFLALIYLGVSLAAALRIVLPAWAAWLATGGAFLVLALGAVLFGAVRMRTSSVAPKEATRTVKEDVKWARAQLKR